MLPSSLGLRSEFFDQLLPCKPEDFSFGQKDSYDFKALGKAMEVLHKEVPWLKVMFHSAGPAPLAIETALSYPALVFPILANLSPKPFSLLSPYSRLMLCVMYVLGVLQLEHYDFPDDLGPAIAIPTHGKSLVERRALLHRHLEKVMKRTFPFDEPRESCWPESLTHPQNGRKNANWLSTAKFTEPSGRREDIAAGTSASDAMDVDEARTPPAVLPELPEIEDEVMEVEMPGGAPPVLSGPLGLEGLEDGAAQAAGLPPSDVPQVPQPVDPPAPPAPVPVGHPPSSPAVSVNPPPPYALTDRTPDPASSAQPSRALSPVVEEPGGPRASPGAGGLPVPSEAGGSPTKAPRRRRDRSASVTAPEVELRRQDRTRKEVLRGPPIPLTFRINSEEPEFGLGLVAAPRTRPPSSASASASGSGAGSTRPPAPASGSGAGSASGPRRTARHLFPSTNV